MWNVGSYTHRMGEVGGTSVFQGKASLAAIPPSPADMPDRPKSDDHVDGADARAWNRGGPGMAHPAGLA